jgi:hypothetical protein
MDRLGVAAAGKTPLVAPMVKKERPTLVPFPVRAPLLASDSPGGRDPLVTLNVGAGNPEALNV